MENSNNSFVSVLKRGSQSHVTPEITKPALVLDDTCIKEFDFGMSLMGRAKDVSAIPNLPCIISKEGFQNVKLSYLGGMWVLFEFDSLTTKEKFLNHSGIGSWFTELIQATSSFENDERIVWISIEGLPIKAWTPNTFRKIASLWGEYVEWEDDDLKSLSCKHLCLKTNMKVIINERQKVIIQGKVYWIRVKELDAWFPNFQEDDQDDLSSDGESQEGDVANKADNNESDVDRVSESSFMHENDTAHKDANSCKKGEVGSHSEDPFNIYGILDGQKNNVCNSCSDEPKFPPGFTPDNNDHEKNVVENIKDTTERVQSLSNKLNDRCSNRGFSSQRSMNSHSQKSKVGGSILDLMDELVTVGQTMGYNMAGLGNKAKRRWIKELCQKHRINFASIQETKAESITSCLLWIILLCLMATWAPTSSKLLIISVYAPQELNERRDLWDYLRAILLDWKVIRDINGVELKQSLFALKELLSRPVFEEAKQKVNDRKINIQQNLSEVDKLIDQGKSNDEILIKRITLLNDLQELNNRNAMKISQKAKIRWSIEGDENSKYFHGIMNKKRSQLAIRGTLANGEWISEPHRVKNEFFTHFKKQFSPIQAPSICFDFTFPTRLSSDQVQDWSPYLISDVQSAFVANRQILDGPFILNELLSWEVALKVLYKRLYALEMCKSISVAEKMGHIPLYLISFRRMPRGGVEQENYGLLCSKVADLVLPNIINRSEVPTRWLRVVPIKVNVHAWRVCLDKLPTRANLSLRGMDISSIACPLCNSAVESTSHIFFAPLARQVWRNFLIWYLLRDVVVNLALQKSIALWEFSTKTCSLIR
ncbi:RNA-directed DNA polymerase, eukaryota [Tanacetum coccineum]